MVNDCDFTYGADCGTCQRCGFRMCGAKPPIRRRCDVQSKPGLGDLTASGLAAIGITKDRVEAIVGGPGTELKQLLSRVGIAAEPGCECNTHAAQMDRWGCDECEQRLEEIVGWLQEEHAKRVKARGTILPWSKLVATNIVKLAIRRARRKESTGPN